MVHSCKWMKLALLTACLMSPIVWTGPAMAESDWSGLPAAGSAQTPDSGLESQTPSYLIGPNDVLNIYVWKEAELTQDVTVMSDGRITFPLIGEIMAAGQTLTALKDTITEKLKNYVTTPEVTVIVRESRSRLIYTVGKLNAPGPYPLQADMTVLQALSAAGGFTEWADTKNILIIRREAGKESQHRFDYTVFISGKELEQNIVLNPNDTIVVP